MNNIEKLIQAFKDNPYLLRMGAKKIAQQKKVGLEDVYEARRLYKEHQNSGLIDHCKAVGIDPNSVRKFWHKSKDFSMDIRNDISQSNLKEDLEDSFEEILSRYETKGVKEFSPKKISEPKALKVTITDDHVGMDPNPDKSSSLFQYEYNGNIYVNSLEKVYQSIIKEYNTYGTFDLLLIDNLGDQEDGWDGLTTRGGHHLMQNMSNSEIFDVCVDSKVRLVESLVNAQVANKIILRSVTNSNHSSQFAIIVNKAIEKIINRLYSKKIVEVEILEKFIEHRTYGQHCFILCHGKDAQHQFKGLPLILNDKTIKYISDYIDFYDIRSPYIHFEKGDLHQLGFQKTRKFDYRNFMSFAPPSAWQQHNFGDSYSGYSIQVIPKYSNEISHTDYFLDYKKKTA